MVSQINLSNREKKYYFLYLIAMLVLAVLILSIIFLYNFKSPFESSDQVSIQTLENKLKFEEQQKVIQPIVDSVFIKTNKLAIDVVNPLKQNDIKYDINSINDASETFSDPRKILYPQIVKFSMMFLNDKESLIGKNGNIKLYNQQYEDCSIDYKNKINNNRN